MRLATSFLLLGLVAGCEIDTAPQGLRSTPPGTGPLVKFDPTRRPLPDIPLPNDVATFADPTSRTGVRVNLSLIAPTRMERAVREGFATMEGWGVSSPITVAFDRAADSDPREPALDLDAVADRMEGDEHDPADDPFYVVNLSTGIPVLVDVESGYYPVVARDPFRYGPNDPKASEPNLIFETVEEGAGLPQSAYRPELDRDFDGVLDHPNTRPRRTSSQAVIAGSGDLVTWYERETDTLILRPIVPLDEKTEYAVVLTDRLRGPSGKPVRSPFEAIHHPTQRAGIARLRDWLTDKRLRNYYGDIAGTGLDRVAFAWTFTTQPTQADMRALRDGLYGKGPFARWKDEYPSDLKVSRAAGDRPGNQEPHAGWETSSAACSARAKTPFILRPNDEDVRSSFRQTMQELFGLEAGALEAAVASLDHVDHVVIGTFASPFLAGDPASRSPDTRFHVDLRTGEGEVKTDDVTWMLVVPKTKGDRRQPFPVAVFGHGDDGHADEALLFGGDFARQGVALVVYDFPRRGRVLGDVGRRKVEALLGAGCLAPFADGISGGRTHGVDGESGAPSWASHVFRARDDVRQSVLDGMNLVRILRSFDGRTGPQDLTGDGKPDVAGDFDGDGVPDVGGPNVRYFAAGRSLGGITSAILGAVDPYVIASAPMSAGGGLAMDVAPRSYTAASAVTAHLLGPIVFAVPAAERPIEATSPPSDDAAREGSQCGKHQRTVRLFIGDGAGSRELELACLEATELSSEMTVVVTNVTSRETRCARTGKDGRFRIAIPTSTGDKLDVQIYGAADAVTSYDGCTVKADAPVGRRIREFERAGPNASAVGTPLIAPSDGLGLQRQSAALRRFRDLAQAALDPADPVAFAPHYMLRPLLDEDGRQVPPHALLATDTVGDNVVPIASQLSFARAAGALPFLPPNAVERLPAYADYATPHELYDRLGRRTPMRFLVDNGVVDGVSRLGRTSAGPACATNYSSHDPALCAQPVAPSGCATALYDADWVSEGRLPYDQPHLDVPLRLARVANVRVVDSTSLAGTWEPRLRGVPFGHDEGGWSSTERVVGLFNQYVTPEGEHAWASGDACRVWDFAVYGNALTARFFASDGRDVFYLSHPKTHGCLVDATCDLFR